VELVVKTFTVIPYKDGRFVPHQPHDRLPASRVSDSLLARIESGDAALLELFERQG
jgi:hypothetical protein